MARLPCAARAHAVGSPRRQNTSGSMASSYAQQFSVACQAVSICARSASRRCSTSCGSSRSARYERRSTAGAARSSVISSSRRGTQIGRISIGARLEHGVREVEADDAMDRGAEVELERLAARRALHLQVLRRRRGSRSAACGRRASARSCVPRPSCGVIAHVMWKRPNWSVVASKPRAVARRTCGMPRSPSSCRPLRFASSKTLPMTSVQSSAGSGTMRTVACASPDSARPVSALIACARFTNSPSPTPEPTASSSFSVWRPSGVTVETGPRELAARDDGLARLAVEARRAFDVAEAGREAVDDGDVGEVHGDAVRDRDHVRHELAARDVARVGVVFVMITDSSRSRSSGMWLLKIWLEPGTKLESNVRCRW